MYSTGIGLVLNGFQKMDLLAKEITEVEQENEKESEKLKDVTTHSDPNKRGKFFDKILQRTKDFFDDKDDKEDN